MKVVIERPNLFLRGGCNRIERGAGEADSRCGHCAPDYQMAYDEELADRIRELVGGQAELREQKMFGGLAFLIDGNMAVAASGRGGLMVRVDPMESGKLVSTTAAEPMEMRGREMRGWLRVSADDVRTKRQLARWVKLGTAYAASLPAKPSKRA